MSVLYCLFVILGLFATQHQNNFVNRVKLIETFLFVNLYLFFIDLIFYVFRIISKKCLFLNFLSVY